MPALSEWLQETPWEHPIGPRAHSFRCFAGREAETTSIRSAVVKIAQACSGVVRALDEAGRRRMQGELQTKAYQLSSL